MGQPVRRRAEQYDSKWEHGKILLMLDTAIHGDEGVVLPGRTTQQTTVRNPNPSSIGHGVDIVTYKLCG